MKPQIETSKIISLWFQRYL